MEVIDNFRRPAKKFYFNFVMSRERKIELLNKMLDAMDKNGKEKKIPTFDIDSCSMHTKKGYVAPLCNM